MFLTETDRGEAKRKRHQRAVLMQLTERNVGRDPSVTYPDGRDQHEHGSRQVEQALKID